MLHHNVNATNLHYFCINVLLYNRSPISPVHRYEAIHTIIQLTIMQPARHMFGSMRAVRAAPRINARLISTSSRLSADHQDRLHPNVDDYRKTQTDRSDNPHMTNTNSTISNEMPSAGKDSVPPEFIKDVDPDFVPKDSVPENTKRMTGETQSGAPEDGPNSDLGVGEMEGAKIKIEPIRREGEDSATMRARLLCPSHSH